MQKNVHSSVRVGSNPIIEFEIRDFGGFWRPQPSILVQEPGFGKIRISVFPDLGLGLAHFYLNRFEVLAFGRGLKGFEVWFCWMNLASSDYAILITWRLSVQIHINLFFVTGSSISTSASAVTAASTTSTSTSSGNKPPRPKWLHCNNCKSPFANAWDLMVHVQTAHMMNIYQLADTTKLQNVRFFSFSFLQKQNR